MPSDITETRTIFDRRESAARSYCRSMPAVFVSASGSELTDAEGRSWIDFLAGCSSLNYGHNDPDMKAALIEHIAGNGIAHGLDLHTDAKGERGRPSCGRQRSKGVQLLGPTSGHSETLPPVLAARYHFILRTFSSTSRRAASAGRSVSLVIVCALQME